MASIEQRETKLGKITYRAKVRIKGHPEQNASFDKISDARKWAAKIESSINEGRYCSESRKHTLAETIDKYCEKILPTKKKSSDQLAQLNWWKGSIGNLMLCDVLPAVVSKYRDILIENKNKKGFHRSLSTVNRYLSALSHVFTIAVKEWQWVDYNPVLRISRQKEPRGRTRFLSDYERKRLLDACHQSSNKYIETIVILCLSTGARKMEIVGLKWEDVDLKRGIITLHNTKNGEVRVLPLVGNAYIKVQELYASRSLYDHPSEFIFPSTNFNQPLDIRQPWEKALKEAGIEDFKFHDLRHSAASYLAMNGASMAEIAEILGHKTLQMVKRYSHLSEAHTSDVVRRMNDKIFGDK
jgi:integrase